MDHRDYTEMIALYAFGYLDEADRLLFEEHLEAGCEACRTAVAEWEDIAADTEYGGVGLDPSPEHRRALLDAVRAQVCLSPMRGRDAALEAALEQVEALANGEGGFLFVEGDGGIGKSRLVAELDRIAADQGALVLQGSSGGGGGDLGYHPFIECLRSWIAAVAGGVGDAPSALRAAVGGLHADRSPELLAALARLLAVPLTAAEIAPIEGIEGDALERLIHRSVREVLASVARRRSVVLILEDLHWADPSSIDMIEAISSLVETSAVLMVCVSRPGHPDTSGRVGEYAAREHALRNHRLVLAALSETDIRAMMRDVLGSDEFPEEAAEFVVSKSGGNPFFAEQTMRSLLDSGVLCVRDGRAILKRELPVEGVGAAADDSIARRLDALSDDERALLEAACVAGCYVHRRVLTHTVDQAVDFDAVLARLGERELLIKQRSRGTARAKVVTLAAERGYVFKHAILRDVVYQSIDGARRRELHLRCAAVIEEVFADRLGDFYAALAVHYARGGDLHAATRYLLNAGSQAATSAASVEALRLFREAHRVYRLTYDGDGPAELEARLESNLALALVNTGHLGESIGHFNTALRLNGQWVPRSKAGMYAKLAWDVPNVLARLYTGAMLRKRSDVGEQQRRVYSLMYNRCRAQNVVDAQRNFFDNFAVFHYGIRHGDPSGFDHAAGCLAATGAFFAWAGLSFAVGRRFLDVAGDLAARSPLVDRFLYRAMAFVYHFHRGDWGSEHDIDPETWAEGLRHGMLWDADVYLGLRCERDLRQGRFAEAEQCIGEMRELCDQYGYAFARSNQLAQTAYLALERRELELAHQAVEHWYESRQEETLHVLALGTRAKIEVLKGDHDGAARTLSVVDTMLRRDTVVSPYHDVVHLASRLRLALARVERASEDGCTPSDDLLAAARAATKPALRVSIKVFRERTEVLGLAARVAWIAGQRDQAFARWRQALEAGEAGRVRPELARVARDIGLALSEQPGVDLQGTSAEAWLDRAREGFAELGASVELAQLVSEQERRRKIA